MMWTVEPIAKLWWLSLIGFILLIAWGIKWLIKKRYNFSGNKE